ncbi:MAG: hypothetical protein IKE55_11070, partial [Kiritimatiellae bacterium]|nr:hypothetical protein [Kiritimatiellia bacterium]
MNQACRTTSILTALAVAAFACGAAVTEQPAVPVGNPDDQIRFFWGLDWRMYDSLPPAGFNMAAEHSHGTFAYDLEKGKGKDGPMSDYEKLAEKMNRDDFIWVVQLLPLGHKYLRKTYPRIERDGTPFHRATDTTAPGCMDELRKYAEYHADVAARIAAKTGCTVGLMPSSEERIFSKPSFAPYNVAAYKTATGRDVPSEATGRAAPHWSKLKGIPADRVVDKDHPVLAFYRWFWKEGEGSPKYIAMVLDTFRSKFGHTPFSMYDPATRMPPLWGLCGDVTHNNQWVMCYPNPCHHAYFVSEQNAFAEGCPGQRVVTMIQGIAASSTIAPTNDLPAKVPEWRRRNPAAVFITPPPDMMLEQIWSAISRKIDGFGFHGWDCLWVLGDDYGRGRNYYRYTNPETRKMVERFFRDVAVPLGPLLKAIPERPGEVAVLDTFASAIMSGEGYWDWDRAAHQCGSLAEAANLSPVTLFEEAIEKRGIPESVKVILASGQGVVTKETAAALKAFKARGGKIVADANFVPAVKADAAFPSDGEVAAAAGNVEEEEVRADDMLPEEMKRTKDCVVRDRKWRARAAALARICRAWAPAYVETDNRHIFLRTRTYGSADYVFAINDKRDFGDYVGPWRRVMEKGVPNEAVVT